MQECVVALEGIIIDNVVVQLIICAGAVSGFCRRWNHFRFCAALFAFYSLATMFHCHIKTLELFAYDKYVMWTLIDVAFLGALFVLLRARLINAYAFIAALALETIAIILHLHRIIDLEATSGAVSSYFYSEGIILTNIGFGALATIPVITMLMIKRKG